jgi:hypothetical protein
MIMRGILEYIPLVVVGVFVATLIWRMQSFGIDNREAGNVGWAVVLGIIASVLYITAIVTMILANTKGK